MAIVVENSYSSGIAKRSISYTFSSVAVAADEALYVVLTGRTKNADDGNFASGITFNGSENFEIVEQIQNGEAIAEIWRLINPTATTADVVVTYPNNQAAWDGAAGGVYVLSGVDISGIPDDGGQNATGSSTSLDIPITTSSGDYTIAVGSVINADGLSEDGDGTELFSIVQDSMTGASSHVEAIDTQSDHSWTASTSGDWAVVGVSINPVAGGAEIDKTYTIDVAFQGQVDETYTIDVPFQGEVDKTYTIDTALKKTDIDKTYTIDVYLALQVDTAYTIDVPFQGPVDTPYTADVAFQDDVDKTYTIDVALKKLDIDKTYTIDVNFSLQKDITYTIDVPFSGTVDTQYTIDVPFIGPVDKEYTMDVALKELSLDTTYTIDVPFQGEVDKIYTIDVYFVGAGVSEKTYTIDVALQGEVDKTYTIDVPFQDEIDTQYTIDVVLILQADITYTIDVALKGEVDTQYTTDVPFQDSVDIQYTADVVFNLTSDVTYTIDVGFLGQIDVTYTIDVKFGVAAIPTVDTSYTIDVVFGSYVVPEGSFEEDVYVFNQIEEYVDTHDTLYEDLNALDTIIEEV